MSKQPKREVAGPPVRAELRIVGSNKAKPDKGEQENGKAVKDAD